MASFQDIIAAHEMFARGKPGGCKAFFRFATLRKIVLQRRNLEDIQFIGCDLRLARLALSNFRFASFYGSKLDQADFRGCDLTRADMRGVSLQGAQLYAARMDEADFRRASLVEIDDDERWQYRTADNGKAGGFVPSVVDFRDCSMRGARLNGAKLQGADFSGAILEGADLSGANLLDASFDDAVLTDVDLENTILSPDALQGALWAPSPEACRRAQILRDAIAAHADWVRTAGREGAKAVLDGEDLRVLGTSFKGAQLGGASLRAACAVSTDFSGASMVGTHFDGADLRDADFSNADLRGSSFRDCNLAHARFDGADLRRMEGRGGRRYRVRFEGANLRNVNLDKALHDVDDTAERKRAVS